jgi:uncharacterized membrane protein YpjA
MQLSKGRGLDFVVSPVRTFLYPFTRVFMCVCVLLRCVVLSTIFDYILYLSCKIRAHQSLINVIPGDTTTLVRRNNLGKYLFWLNLGSLPPISRVFMCVCVLLRCVVLSTVFDYIYSTPQLQVAKSEHINL